MSSFGSYYAFLLLAFPFLSLSLQLPCVVKDRSSSLLRPYLGRTRLGAGLGDVVAGLTNRPPAKLEPPQDLLFGTSIDPRNPDVELTRCYKASMDGWSATDFHRCVDMRGSAIVVALSSSSDKRFGGFNPSGWMSTDDYVSSNAAFLWFERGGGGGGGADAFVRAPVLSGGGACVFDYATGGPCFGASDLQIGPPRAAVMGGFAGPDMEDVGVNSGDLRECVSSPGGAYECPKGWPCRGKVKLVEVEVYCNGNIDPSGGGGGGFKLWPF